LETVNPTRGAPASARRYACRTKAPTDARAPRAAAFAAARKSFRRFNRSMKPTFGPFELNEDQRAPVARRFRLKHSISYGHARGARPKPCGRLWSPCECESHGGACVPICSADRSVSREISAAGFSPAALRLASGHKPPRLARLISEGSPPVNVTCQPFAGIFVRHWRRSSPLGQRTGQDATAIRQRLSTPKPIDVM
jgi:hypothetical protein